VLPNNFFVVLIGFVVISTVLWLDHTSSPLRTIGAVEWAFALYIAWNICSMLAPHKYGAGNPLTGESFSVPRFIVTAAVIPFVMFVVGRYTFDRERAVRLLLWTIQLMAAYSAAVSIMKFTGPTGWVWPRFIVDGSRFAEDETWADRAVGVFNQPVVNGMTMALGFAVAMLLASRRSEPIPLRVLSMLIGVACGFGVYLTHTRAAWLSGAVVLVVGALLAKGYRRGFISGLLIAVGVIALNWSVFTSSDRNAGGVASESELNDRLNLIGTALWAGMEKPIAGWGIQRFQVVNTFHHQQWAPDIPWMHGYGIVSHSNEFGILVELGLIGLALWVAIVALIAYRLWDAYRTLPDGDLCGRPLVIIAVIALAIMLCTGLTVDLRLFDFPTATVFLLVGTAIGWRDRRRTAVSAHDVASAPQCGQHA
jgi:O-antigen ligase